MRLLLDESVPAGLKRVLTAFEVRTVPEMGRAGITNGRRQAVAAVRGSLRGARPRAGEARHAAPGMSQRGGHPGQSQHRTTMRTKADFTRRLQRRRELIMKITSASR